MQILEHLLALEGIGTPAVASGAVVNDGILLVGGGIGARSPVTGDFPSTSTTTSWFPNNITVLCVPGTTNCPL
jgi:hypothetical protein